MNKKIPLSNNKAGSKDTKGRTKSSPKALGEAEYTLGASLRSDKVKEGVGFIDVGRTSTFVSFYFLPELVKEKQTFEFEQIRPLLTFLGYNQGESSELLETNASTLSRWKNSNKPVDIGKLRSKIVLDIDEIVAKGVRVFGSEQLFQEWLNAPNYALGDAKPVDLLKDVYSIELVEDAIDALSWGSYI